MAAPQMMQSGGTQGRLNVSPRVGSGASAGPLPSACDDAGGTASTWISSLPLCIVQRELLLTLAGWWACVDWAAICSVWAADHCGRWSCSPLC